LASALTATELLLTSCGGAVPVYVTASYPAPAPAPLIPGITTPPAVVPVTVTEEMSPTIPLQDDSPSTSMPLLTAQAPFNLTVPPEWTPPLAPATATPPGLFPPVNSASVTVLATAQPERVVLAQLFTQEY
jgi:hypothetical protein